MLESEQIRFQAQTTRDTALLVRLLADNLVYIHSNALVERKADFLRSVSGGGIRYLSIRKMEDSAVSQWGKTAVSHGLVEVKGLYQGNEFDMTLRFTSVYRREKGRWKLYSWQSTRVP